MVVPVVAEFPFDKTKRLLKAADFKPVFDNAQFKISSKGLLFLSKHNRINNPRLGLVIAKKNIRLAVQRNRLKRIIRESFRLNQANIPNLDIVVLARKGLDAMDNSELQQHVAKLWQQLQHKASS